MLGQMRRSDKEDKRLEARHRRTLVVSGARGARGPTRLSSLSRALLARFLVVPVLLNVGHNTCTLDFLLKSAKGAIDAFVVL